ncbi:MAG: argininosuccinate lyase [Rhodothermales bacterium]|nr:argininosuccinate lyase [Rhodothermales bacterium]MBO6779380.1 argininosuccinate lyase [Rhodothermales bacterium]
MKPIWNKDGTGAEDWVTRFTVGEDHLWDTVLLPYDLTASEAHAWGLAQIGVLGLEELVSIQQAFQTLREEHAAGTLQVTREDEDCHTVIERRLTEMVGDPGRKIHTGRSRNDQVLAALRLYLRDQAEAAGHGVRAMALALCDLADRHPDTFLPGYTHLQRAMPSTVALWALGFAELAAGDLELLGQSRAQINSSPLGSAAGYGVPALDLPREAVAARLGFERVQTHVTSVQLSRGKAEAALVHALLQTTSTINRLASDLVLYNTSEFGFVTLPREYTTGSSIMPQKRNPDVLELARASYHRVAAEFSLLTTLPANLSSGYHRDLQLTKEAVMRAVRVTGDVLIAMNAVLPGVRFNPEATRAADDPALHATTAALNRVRDGQAFRDAYRDVAGDREAWTQAMHASTGYVTPGTPGQEDADAVRRLIGERGSWL